MPASLYLPMRPLPPGHSIARPSDPSSGSTDNSKVPFLPEEIWARIISFVPFRHPYPIGDFSWNVGQDVLIQNIMAIDALAKICRTSKQFHRLAMPQLYSQPPVWGTLHGGTICQKYRTHFFFRAVSKRLENARWVKEARIGVNETKIDYRYVRQTFANVIGGIGQPSSLVLKVGLTLSKLLPDTTLYDAANIFYIMLIPNVKRLGLSLSPKPEYMIEMFRVASRLLNDTTQSPGNRGSTRGIPLSCLKVLHLRSGSITSCVLPSDLMDVLGFPTLETLIGSNLDWESGARSRPLSIPYSCVNANLKTMHMRLSKLTELGLVDMTYKFPNLTCLHIDDCTLEPTFDPDDLQFLGDLLRLRGRKLQRLKIKFITKEELTVGSLHQLAQLKSLWIAYATLARSGVVAEQGLCNNLPFQLQYLQLTETREVHGAAEEAIYELLMDERFSALEGVMVEGLTGFGKDLKGRWATRLYARQPSGQFCFDELYPSGSPWFDGMHEVGRHWLRFIRIHN